MNRTLSDTQAPPGAAFGPEVRLSGAFPLVLEAVLEPFDWAAWAVANAAAVRDLVHRHGALLLRGAAAADPGQFVGFAEALCPELYTGYGDLGDAGSSSKTYAPTHYPLELPIHVHNESACNSRWPLLLFFHCVQPALEGGASRLVDGRKVLAQLPGDLRGLLDQAALIYTRNHNPDLDTSWQRFYSSEDPREVEKQCRGNGVRFRWKPGQVLQTDTVRPPILPHPVSGEPVLFHQLFLFHPQGLEAETRRSLSALFPESEFPRAITHEGGLPVAAATFQRLFDLYERNAVEVAMQRGDILVIDNMVVGHGRAPFRGPRRMRVAMGMMIDDRRSEDLAQAPREAGADPVAALKQPMTRSVYPSVVALIEERARQSPGAVALSRGNDRWTYATLLSFARGAARALRARGIGAGDVVAVAGEQRFETIGAMLAVWMAGGVLMPLDAATPPLRLRAQLGVARCHAVLDCGSLDLPVGDIPVVRLAELAGGAAPDFRPVPVGPDDPAYIFFTSGSTGAAKGIRGVHGGLGHFLCWQREQFGISAADVFAQLTRLSFDVMLRDVFTPLASGARLCLPPDETVMTDPWAWLRDEGVTAIHVVPSLLSRWLALPGSDKACPALRLAFSAGEALDSAVVDDFRRQVAAGCRIINLYGPTETTLAKCWYEVPAFPERGTQPLGAPLPETQIHVLDENGLPCAPGATGEIVIRTPHRSAGYLDADGANHAGFRPNPQRDDPADLLFFSGDLGRFDAAGALHIAGRVDDQLKILGVRISPQEIAATLAQHAAIRQAQVIGDGKEVPQLVAFVVADEAQAPREGLIAFLAERLPLAMIPARYIYLEALPTTERGKVDRAALAAMASAAEPVAPAARQAGTPLQTVTERELASLWEALLGCAPAFREANFIALGGHSLLTVQLLSRIRQRWQSDLDIRDVFRNLSLSDMARRIDQGSGQGSSKAAVPAPVLQPRPARLRGDAVRLPLSSTQQRLWFLAQLEPGSGHYNIPGAVRFRGKLDANLLQRCVDEIVARHEPFRTRFVNDAGEPWQVVASEVALPVQRLDLKQLDAAERLAGCADAAGQAARSPFDLAAAPLLRLLLIELDEDDAVLVYTFNHLIADGWTNVIFVRELCQLYATWLESPAAPARQIADTLQYADYALWEQQLPAAHYQDGLEYWKAALKDMPDRLHLPTDRPRPAMQTHSSDECTARLSAGQTRALQRFCREHDVTLFIAVLTFFKIALHRASGARDLCVGTPVANRGLQALEHTYGCFINTLAIRSTLREGSTFRDCLGSVRDSVIAALAHQEVPFDKVVEAVAPARSPGHHPLFQVLLNVLHWEETPLTHPHISAHREWLVPPQSKFDMTLYVRQHHELIDLHLVYNPDLFDRSRAQGWLGDLVGLLQECLDGGADRPIRSSGQASQAAADEPATAQPVAIPPREWTPTELALSAIWRDLLGRERFELTDNFFRLGGYSLLATRLVAVIRDRLAVVVPVWKLFELPSIVELAGFIDDVKPSSPGAGAAEPSVRAEANALVPAQQMLWQLHAAQRDGHHYNVPRAVRLLGELRHDALQRAVDAVVQRHPALRTLYDDSGASVVPRVLPAADVPVRELQLGPDLPDELACIEREMTHRFDLRSEIPLRVALLRLTPAEHVLIVTTHHIAADCWSMGLPFQALLDDGDPWHYGVFFRDLVTFYDEFTGHAAASGQQAAAGEQTRFEDIFATMQVAQGLQDWPKALGFWRNYLHGASQSISLPTDAPQPCSQFLAGRRSEFSIGRGSYAGLQKFSRENRTTDFVTLFTVFSLAIRQWAGADDFLVGVPVSNRGTQAAENLIGHIGNTVVLRARLEETDRPAQLARRLHEEIHAALAYQYYPFDELVKELGQEQESGRSPLFQVRFVFQNMPEASARPSGLTLRPVQFDRGVSKYDLSLVIATQGGKLRGWCEYKTPLFAPATIDAFIRVFLGALDRIV
jgi:amino acid adenylation domain-containing protein